MHGGHPLRMMAIHLRLPDRGWYIQNPELRDEAGASYTERMISTGSSFAARIAGNAEAKPATASMSTTLAA